MAAKLGTLLVLMIVGTMIADMVSHPAGTTSLFSGLQKVWQIMTNPLNTKGL